MKTEANLTNLTTLEKGDVFRFKNKKNKGGEVLSVISIHNIHAMYADGTIVYFCMDPNCPEYSGDNIIFLKK